MYDIIIAGGGPAGTTCANFLGQERNVLLLEKEKFPRYKACGGALSFKAASLLNEDLNLDINKISENNITQVSFVYKFEDHNIIHFDYPVLHMCMRDKFDDYLLRLASQKGAKVKFEEEVLQIEETQEYIKIKTNKGQYKSKYFVGAEGASSFTAKKIGLSRKKVVAVEGELTNKALEEFTNKNRVELHYGLVPFGYGWVFPKENNLSIGVGAFLHNPKNLKNYYYHFKNGLGLKDKSELIIKAHALPLFKEMNPTFHKGRMLVVGDAAGLVDPLCGEGIYYAGLSGKLAAEAILNEHLEKYSRNINEIIMPELQYANILSSIIYNNMSLINKLVKRSPELTKRLLKVICGETQYSDLFNSLSNIHPIFNIYKNITR